MVFLWFSYGFHHKSHEISTQQGLRRCAAALHQSHPGFSWAPKKAACLVKKGETVGKTMGKHGVVLGKPWGTQKKSPWVFAKHVEGSRNVCSLEPVGLQETGDLAPVAPVWASLKFLTMFHPNVLQMPHEFCPVISISCRMPLK